jgi:hypothetical protein
MTPGSNITIRLNEALASSKLEERHVSPRSNGFKTYSSVIRWCRKLEDNQSISSFACGVKVF